MYSLDKENFNIHNINEVDAGNNVIKNELLKCNILINNSIRKKIFTLEENDQYNKLLKKNDYFYIFKHNEFSAEELKNAKENYTQFATQLLKNEIKYLEINNISKEEIGSKVNQGCIFKTCKKILKKTSYYRKFLDNFSKTNKENRIFRLGETCVVLKKHNIQWLLIEIIIKSGENFHQAFNCKFQDGKNNLQHLIVFGHYQKDLNICLWSGQNLPEKISDDWRIYNGNNYLIQKIYNLTTHRFLVLKNVRMEIKNYKTHANYLMKSFYIHKQSFNSQNTDPFTLKGICPIYAAINQKNLHGIISPKMDGDCFEIIQQQGAQFFSNRPFDFIREIFRLIQVLEDASKKNIFYVDFKLDNILYKFSQDNRIKLFLGDWDGISNFMGNEALEYYKNGMFPGPISEEYSCLEDRELFADYCKKNLDEGFDVDEIRSRVEAHVIYTIGSTIWALLTEIFVPSEEIQIKQIINEMDLYNKWPTEFINLMLWMINKNYTDRPSFEVSLILLKKFL
ncbi:MAG: hypothetical protein Q8K60_02205 [Parachlamydiaceae bacterium]|nr:hypothetical protein [Parachlamydiaceae bacterium]